MPTSTVYRKLTCPYCGHQGLVLSSGAIQCEGCNKEIGVEDLRELILKYSPLDIKKASEVEYLTLDRHVNYKSLSSITPSLFHEISDKERKKLYYKTFAFDFVILTALYVFLSQFFQLSKYPWPWMIGLFLASRFADIVSTVIALELGGTETNPLSDPHDISRLLASQIQQIVFFIVLSFVLGLVVSPWLQTGYMFVYSMLGFVAFFANLGQTMIYPLSAAGSDSPYNRHFRYHFISIVIVSVITIALLTYVLK